MESDNSDQEFGRHKAGGSIDLGQDGAFDSEEE